MVVVAVERKGTCRSGVGIVMLPLAATSIACNLARLVGAGTLPAAGTPRRQRHDDHTHMCMAGLCTGQDSGIMIGS